MPRLLHLYDPHPDFQTQRAIEQLSAGLRADFDVSSDRLWSIGFRRQCQSADILHAWGLKSLTAAALTRVPRLLFTPTDVPTPRQIRWLRAILNYRDLHVICPTSTLRRALIERGIPLERCHLIRPGVDFSRLKPKTDRSLRAALGFEEADQVILAVGESTPAADHRQAVWAGTIINVLDRKTRMILWGRGPLAPDAARFAANLGQPKMLRLAERNLGRSLDFEDLLPAADMAVVSATGPVATLPIAITMAAGVPIVAAVTSTVSELLEDRHTALMVPPAVPRLLALRILQMREDAQLRWQLTDTARTEAYEYFSLTRFLQQYREIYRQISQVETVQVPEPAPGAAARFRAS
jgi:glycosyltransferase involved in cell wall biosynthesis